MPALISVRVETVPTSRMLKQLWQHDRAIVFADGWFEWKMETEEIANNRTAPAERFIWHTFSCAVDSVKKSRFTFNI